MLVKFDSVVGAMCSVCLMSSRLSISAVVIEASLSDVVPIVSRLSATKLLHVADDRVQVGEGIDRPCSGRWPEAGHRRQVLVELLEQVTAVVQRRHQDRQILERREDVSAVVAERRHRLGQFDDRVADVGALTAQVVGGGVDERTQRAHPARARWAAAARSAAAAGRAPRSHSTGTAVRSAGMTAPSRMVGPPV